MRASHVTALVLGIMLAPPGSGLAEPSHGHNTPSTRTTLELEPELHQLLQQEMVAIQSGMQSLVPDIAAGNWASVAETGEKLQNTYIFRQQLTEAQREELHEKLPAGFQELDQSFHHAAGMLAHAAHMKNADVVNFYFYKLVDGCVSCHAKFATHRFPGFSAGRAATDNNH
jgi:cytochrome c556